MEHGSKYYIVLKGAVYCFIPDSSQGDDSTECGGGIIDHTILNLKKDLPNMICAKIYLPGESFGEIALMTH